MGKSLFIIIALLLSGLAGFSLSWYIHRDPVIVLPQKDVKLIATFHRPAIFVQQLMGDLDAGRKIYKEFCASCHDKQPVIDVNAPPIGDKKAWAARKKLGMNRLLNITISGVGVMPARGGCFECSDQQLRATIQYLLDQS